MTGGACNNRILALLLIAPFAILPHDDVNARSSAKAEAAAVEASQQRPIRTAALPREKKPASPVETSAPRPDRKTKKSLAFGLR